MKFGRVEVEKRRRAKVVFGNAKVVFGNIKRNSGNMSLTICKKILYNMHRLVE